MMMMLKSKEMIFFFVKKKWTQKDENVHLLGKHPVVRPLHCTGQQKLKRPQLRCVKSLVTILFSYSKLMEE